MLSILEAKMTKSSEDKSKKEVIDIDKAIAEKFMTKYGFAYDMFLIFENWKEIPMSTIIKAFNGIIARGGLKVERECDVEEFIEKSYSVYIRRFARMPRRTLYEHYKSVYGDTVKLSHKAFMTDKPNAIDEEVLVEIKGGHIDADSLSAPGYLSILKVRITDQITGIKVIYNSQLHKLFWEDMININMMLGGVLTSIYETEGIYGRSTSLSIRSETLVRIAKGQIKETIQERGVLQNDLKNYGLDINKILDICDSEVSALNVPTELRMIYDTIETQCKETGTSKSLVKLIKRIEDYVIPMVREKGSLPTLAETFTFARGFLLSESREKFANLVSRPDDKEKKMLENELDSLSAGLAQSILAYVRYSTLLTVEPQCEMKYLVLGIDRSAIVVPENSSKEPVMLGKL